VQIILILVPKAKIRWFPTDFLAIFNFKGLKPKDIHRLICKK
jgi:hypothetical protein